MGGAVDFVGGLAEGAAEGQRHAVQKQYNQAMLKKFKADLDLQEKKQAYIAAHPELQDVALGLRKPPSEVDTAKAKLFEWAMGGGQAPAMVEVAPSAAQQPQGPKFGASFGPNPTGIATGQGGSGYQVMLQQAMKDQGVPETELPYLMAMMQTESSFRPAVKGTSGEVGLFQIMPKTAQDLGVTDRADPWQNIVGGVKYYKQNLERFGNRDAAIQAHNAGPEAVAKYRGNVPYPVTQNYLRTVNAAAPQYGGFRYGVQPSLTLGQPAQAGVDRDALRRGMLKKELGYEEDDWTPRTLAGPGNIPYSVPFNKRTKQYDWSQAAPEPTDFIMVDVTMPGGGPGKAPLRKGSDTPDMTKAIAQPYKQEYYSVETPEGTFRASQDPYAKPPVLPGDLAPQGQAAPSGVPPGAVKTAPAKGGPVADVGRIQLAQSGLVAFDDIKSMVFDEKGKINRGNLFNSTAGMPWTTGRNLAIRSRDAADAILRAATGAAMTKEEEAKYNERYVPSYLDDEATVRSKMTKLSEFLNGYLEKIDPSGTLRARVGTPESFKKQAIPKTADDYLKSIGR